MTIYRVSHNYNDRSTDVVADGFQFNSDGALLLVNVAPQDFEEGVEEQKAPALIVVAAFNKNDWNSVIKVQDDNN